MYLHLPPPLILQFFPRLAVSLTNPRPEVPVWGRAKGTQSQCFSSFLLLFSLLEQKKVCWMVFPGKICPFLGSDFVLVSALHFCTALVFAFLHDGTPGGLSFHPRYRLTQPVGPCWSGLKVRPVNTINTVWLILTLAQCYLFLLVRTGLLYWQQLPRA